MVGTTRAAFLLLLLLVAPQNAGAFLIALLDSLEETKAVAALLEHNCSLSLELADLQAVLGETGNANGTNTTARAALEALLNDLELELSHLGAVGSAKVHLRLCLFAKRFAEVTEHNRRGSKARFEVNFFSLLREEEAIRFVGFVEPNPGDIGDSVIRAVRTGVPRSLASDPPTDVDWTGTAVPEAAQNQGACGSCWAFSAAEMIGALAYIEDNATTAVVLSAQQLTSCAVSGNSGCQGGNFQNVWTRYTPSTPLTVAGAYPYTSSGGVTGACDATSEATGVVKAARNVQLQDTGSNGFASNELLQEVLLEHPISIAMLASTSCFQSYRSGILTPGDCPDAMVAAFGQRCPLDHAVLLVGYGNLGAPDAYYKIKNSWGTWGEDGYVRFAMLDANEIAAYSCYGMLGMGESAAYPQTTSVVGTPGPTNGAGTSSANLFQFFMTVAAGLAAFIPP